MEKNKRQAKLIFWIVYLVFLITTFFARNIFGLIFAGPLFAVIYSLIILTSFVPFRISMTQFEKAKGNPEKSKYHIRLAWIAFALSIPLKLVLIVLNFSEIIEPTSNHWNFG